MELVRDARRILARVETGGHHDDNADGSATWRREWDAISARSIGPLDAARFHVETLGVNGEDTQNVATDLLIRDCREIWQRISAFYIANGESLQPLATQALSRFLGEAVIRHVGPPGVYPPFKRSSWR